MGWFSGRSPKDLKSQADDAYTHGHWAEALQGYQRLSQEDPGNVKILRRVADLRARLGRRREAVEAYRKVVELYAESGFLMQAIAIQKILLRLDPQAEDVGPRLAELYAQRGFGGRAEPQAGRTLPEIPLFSDLDPEAFQQVVGRLVPREVQMGEALFREGDPGDSIFVLTSGRVKVSRGPLTLAELGEGEFFGEGAFFSHQPRNADVVAVAPTELLEIRRRDLEELMAQSPALAEALAVFYRRRVLDGVLASSPVFGRLPERERKRVADLFRISRVGPGETVIREGDTDRTLFLVKRGRFRVTSTPPGGGEPVELAQLGPGEFFGEVALVSATPRTATVAAADEGELLQVAAEALAPVLRAHPEVLQALEQTRNQRAADTVATLLGRKP